MANIVINQDSLKTNREFKRHLIQPGSNIYRILPPFGEVSTHNNYPYKKWTLAWMLDPSSGRRKPFAIPYVEKNGDPVSKFVATLTTFLDNLKKELAAKGADEDQVRELTSKASDVVWQLRPKTAYYYNAANKAGEVGILELKSTAHQSMKASMDEYIRDYAQDPTSLGDQEDDSGVWLNIKRDGEKGAKDTKYSVQKHQMKVKENGKISFVDDREALPDNVIQNYEKLGYDLYNLYQEKTIEELESILRHNIKLLTAEIPLLARVPGYGPSAKRPAAIVEEPIQDDEEPAPAPKPLTKPQGKKPVVLAMDLAEDEEAPAPVAKPAPKPAAKPAATDLDDLDALLGMIE